MTVLATPSANCELPTDMIKIVITGSGGRMGQALVACAKNFRELEIAGQIDQGDDLRACIGKADVVVDFSSHTATAGIVSLCAENKKALVIGTTGHSESERAEIGKRKSQIPIVFAPNFSTGVNTLFWLTRQAAEILGPALPRAASPWSIGRSTCRSIVRARSGRRTGTGWDGARISCPISNPGGSIGSTFPR